jgi:hypothetical protein
MRSILFLSVVALFISCGENQEVNTQETSGASADVKEIVKHFEPASITKLNVADIPASCVTKGKVKSAFKWTDKLGENIFIAAETGEIYTPEKQNDDEYLDPFKEAHLYAYHYVISGSEVKLLRELHDFVSECQFDVEASFIPSTIQITDLNSDATGEIWMMYETYCLSDVSPSDLKIIMFQNGQKYALRGSSQIDWEDGSVDGGQFKFDEAFGSSPESFRDFAKTMWNQHKRGN